VNNLNNAIKRLLLNHIFVQPLVSNAGQQEQSHTGTLALFTLFTSFHAAANK
jgi:hypothetical protein